MAAAKKNPAPSTEAPSEAGYARAIEPERTVAVLVPTAENPDEVKAMTALSYAETFTIATAADSAKGQEASQRLNAAIKTLDDQRLDLTRPLDALKTKWMKFFAAPIDKYKAAKKILDTKLIDWQEEQEEIRKAEQRRLDKIAEDERKRLQDIADAAQRKADAEAAAKRKAAEEAAAAGRKAEADRLNAQAARVEELAANKAELFESRAAAVVAPVVLADTAKVAGSSFRDHWEFEVTDVTKINSQFLMPDRAKIEKTVQSLKLDAVGVVGAGLKVTSRKILASRRT